VTRAYDAESGALLGAGGNFDVLTLTARDVLIQVGDAQGGGGEGFGFTLSLSARALEAITALPFDTEGALAVPGESDLYTLTLPAGQLVDLRVETEGSAIGLAELAVFDAGDLAAPFQTSFSRSLLLQSEAERAVVLRVRDLGNGGGPDFTYRLGIARVEAQAQEALPLEVLGALTTPARADWYAVTAPAGERLLVQATGQGGLVPQVFLYALDGGAPLLLRSSTEGEFVVLREQETRLLVGVADSQNRGMEGFDYALRVGALAPTAAAAPFAEDSTLAVMGAKRYYELDAPSPGRGPATPSTLWRGASPLGGAFGAPAGLLVSVVERAWRP
jgi:hypothetical protein